MIQLIAFDLDGVLVEAKEIHYNTLNDAIFHVTRDKSMVIGWEEHLSTYDGLKTDQKLHMLTTKKGLPQQFHKAIWEKKQQLTLDAISALEPDERLRTIFRHLRDDGYKLAVCSNSIRRSVLTMLAKLGLIEYLDLIISNEDVKNSKPHPQMYWHAMSTLGVLPEETLVVEDSPPGLLAAARSRAHVLRVDNPHDLTYEKLQSKLQEPKTFTMPKWQGGKMNVLIPMAGAGSRFQQELGLPKYLADVGNKPMIQSVVENLGMDANFIYVVLKRDYDKFNLDGILNLITPNCTIIPIDSPTTGALITALYAKEYIDVNDQLIIANCDQLLEWNSNEFMYKMVEQDIDVGVVTFYSTLPKYSYVKLDGDRVIKTAEKNVISDVATAGVYYFRSGKEFVQYAENYVRETDTTSIDEFYIVPMINEYIKYNKQVISYPIKNRVCFGDFTSYRKFVETEL